VQISEYLIKCPNCLSETRLVAEESNPLIFHCHGCERSVVVQGNVVYTVSQDFLEGLINRFRSKPCGRVISARLSESSEELITNRKIHQMQNLLEQSKDVSEFIKKIS